MVFWLRRDPELGLAIVVLEKVYPKPYTQRQVFALRKNRVYTVRRRIKLRQHRHQFAGSNLGLDFLGAAPGDAITRHTPVV